MDTAATRKLADDQLKTFADYDYVTPELFDGICSAIAHDFPDGRFSFIDIGGGRGLFADRLLAQFPGSHGVLLDNSDLLLSMNAEHARKTLVLGSATEVSQLFRGVEFDVAFFNLSLHHFISDDYQRSRQLQRYALQQVMKVLSLRGRIAVTENLFDGYLARNFPSVLIYALTSSKLLAPVVKRLGANTAGCGVCFLSTGAWRDEFRRAGLCELQFGEQLWHEAEPLKELCLRLLGVKSVARAYFWLGRR